MSGTDEGTIAPGWETTVAPTWAATRAASAGGRLAILAAKYPPAKASPAEVVVDDAFHSRRRDVHSVGTDQHMGALGAGFDDDFGST